VTSKSIVILSKNGKAELYKEIMKNLGEAVKIAASEALTNWKTENSDFIIIRDRYPVEIQLPITKEEFELYSKFNLKRTGSKTAAFELPVYIISFNNEWVEEEYIDHEVYVVTLKISEKITQEIVEWASEITSKGE